MADRDCNSFATWADAKAFYDLYYPYYGDLSRLDRDNDGIPCETLPGAPKGSSRTGPAVTYGEFQQVPDLQDVQLTIVLARRNPLTCDLMGGTLTFVRRWGKWVCVDVDH